MIDSSAPTVNGVGHAAGTDVTTACLRFFDPTVAEAHKLELIQDGTAFSPAISRQSRSRFAEAASIPVHKVRVTSANKATVIYTLLLDGKASLHDETGHAVRENGKWKVSGATFCGLLSAQGALPPLCKTPSATTLPG